MLDELKERVCLANKDLEKYALVIYTWGNVSEIDPDRRVVAIKPSGVDYESLTPEDIVLLDLEGNVIEGDKRPSSDTPTHLELYRNFSGVYSIVHTHSTYATSFAQAGREVACLGTTHADYFYGSVPATRELSREEITEEYEKNTGRVIVEHYKRNDIDPLEIPACLVSGHGPFAWGKSSPEAVHNAVVLERICEMNLSTLSINREAKPIKRFLLDKHYLRKHGRDAYYGQGGK